MVRSGHPSRWGGKNHPDGTAGPVRRCGEEIRDRSDERSPARFFLAARDLEPLKRRDRVSSARTLEPPGPPAAAYPSGCPRTIPVRDLYLPEKAQRAGSPGIARSLRENTSSLAGERHWRYNPKVFREGAYHSHGCAMCLRLFDNPTDGQETR